MDDHVLCAREGTPNNQWIINVILKDTKLINEKDNSVKVLGGNTPVNLFLDNIQYPHGSR